MQIVDLALDQVVLGDRLRAVDEAKAAEIAVSFKQSGQIQPIEVGPADEDGRHVLIAGGHRVRAAQLAGWTTIAASISDAEGDQARLREIDENLYRHELSAYDQAAFLAERIDILERLQGKVQRGRKPNSANLPNYLKETADLFGLSDRDVRRAVERRRGISQNLWRALAGTRFVQRGSDLDALRKLVRPQQDRLAVQLTARSEFRSLAELFEAAHIGTRKARPDGFDALIKAWNHATADAQGRFRDWLVKAGEIDG